MDTVCFGEALIDFKEEGTLQFQGYEGGSPYNVAIAAARLGSDVGFASCISSDMFGSALKKYLLENNVDISLVEDSSAPSTLAFVSERDGDAHFSFIDKGAADTLYDPQPRPNLASSVKQLQLGSISLLNTLSANSIRDIVQAHKEQATVFYDPNIRPALVESQEDYFVDLPQWLDLANVVKVSSQDLEWLYPDKSFEEVAEGWLEHNLDALLITDGEVGIKLYRKNQETLYAPSVKVEVKDTVGAGDTFTASLMNRLLNLDKPLSAVSAEEWVAVMNFAAHAAALNCMQDGANPPTLSEVEAFMQSS